MEDIRQSLLVELIDNMHGRLAEKMFPHEKEEKDDQPAATEIPGTEAMVEEKAIDSDDDSMSDEDIEEMMKGME